MSKIKVRWQFFVANIEFAAYTLGMIMSVILLIEVIDEWGGWTSLVYVLLWGIAFSIFLDLLDKRFIEPYTQRKLGIADTESEKISEHHIQLETLQALEKEVCRLWGPSMFDWVIGRTIAKDGNIKNAEDHVWFFYCGERFVGETGRKQWKHKGYEPNIVSCLLAMIDLGKKELEGATKNENP